MFKKTVFLFAWLGIFIMSILCMTYVFIPTYFIAIDLNSFLFKVILFSISFIYLCITLLKLCSNFSKEAGYTIENENGNVFITNDTIKNIVKGTLAKDEDVKETKISCGKRGKKYFIKLDLEVLADISISNKTIEIQKIIREDIDTKLGLIIDLIEVKISKLAIQK